MRPSEPTRKISINDGTKTFEATVIDASLPLQTVLFAVGGGGDPARHLPLLSHLAAQGCTVVAPHFERMMSWVPTADDLLLRARRLTLALDAVSPPGMRVSGVGHSIGATMLLGLAGGHVWMHAGKRLDIIPDARLDRLALLAPATGFFQAPGALDEVQIPLLAWAGTEDEITPPSHVELLRDTLGSRIPLDIRITTDAGHFSFMNELPPTLVDPHPDREAFLEEIATEISRFLTRPNPSLRAS